MTKFEIRINDEIRMTNEVGAVLRGLRGKVGKGRGGRWVCLVKKSGGFEGGMLDWEKWRGFLGFTFGFVLRGGEGGLMEVEGGSVARIAREGVWARRGVKMRLCNIW